MLIKEKERNEMKMTYLSHSFELWHCLLYTFTLQISKVVFFFKCLSDMLLLYTLLKSTTCQHYCFNGNSQGSTKVSLFSTNLMGQNKKHTSVGMKRSHQVTRRP